MTIESNALLEKLEQSRIEAAGQLADAVSSGGEIPTELVNQIQELDEWIKAVEAGEPRCRYCGGDNFRVWYKADEAQGIDLLGVEDGQVRYEYDGDTESGDLGEDDEFVCRNCWASSSSLEYLTGLTDEEPAPNDLPTDKAREEAILNIETALGRLGRFWEEGMDDDLSETQAELEQALRFLRGKEQPS